MGRLLRGRDVVQRATMPPCAFEVDVQTFKRSLAVARHADRPEHRIASAHDPKLPCWWHLTDYASRDHDAVRANAYRPPGASPDHDRMFSPILAWLSGDASCSPPDLAVALRTSAEATLASMVAASSA